ncbi:PASTA domain-containing protein [Spirillospora sp. NPDC000708]
MRARAISAIVGMMTALALTACSTGNEEAHRTAPNAPASRISAALPSYKGKTLDAVSREREGAAPSYTTVFRSLTDGHAFDGESYSGTWIVCTQTENAASRTVEFGMLPPQVPCPADGRVTAWPTVPDVVGKTGFQAKQIGERVGFQSLHGEPSSRYGDSHLERVVCRQDPPAGESMRTHYGEALSVVFVDPAGPCDQ